MAKDDIKILVSVIICAFSTKRFDMTVSCIYSIFDNIYKNYEIILVVDGNEQLKQMLYDRFKDIDKVTVIGNEKDEGPSIARNRGIEIAKGEIVAFIDDDAFAPKDWLEHIVKNFSDYSDIMVIGGKLLPMYNGNYCDDKCEKLPEEILWLVGCTYKGHAENRQFVRNVISANMAVRKNIFNEIDFEYMPISKKRLFAPIKQLEDTLFCIRVNNRKVDTVLYDPDIVIYHNVPAERLKLSYIIKRSFSEGILKAQLGYAANKDNNNENTIRNNDGNKVLHYEQNYLYSLLTSIIKNFFLFKIRDNILLSITIISVVAGYVSEVVTHWAE